MTVNPITALIVLGLVVVYPTLEWLERHKFEIQRQIPALDRWLKRRKEAKCQWFRDHLPTGGAPDTLVLRRELDRHLYQEACTECFDYQRLNRG